MNRSITSFVKLRLILISGILFSFVLQSNGQNIAQWRGTNRDGHYYERTIRDSWSENGPEMLWYVEGLGKGYASPTILNGKVLVNGEIDSISHLFAFDLKGNQLWTIPNGPEFMGEGFSSTYPGSRSAPTIVDNLAYITSGKGRLTCVDIEKGSVKWTIDLKKDFDGYDHYFGYSESVIVDDGKVYCYPGGDKINLAAFDRMTGEVVWTSEALKDTFAYCSPILVEFPSRKVIVTTSRHNLFVFDCTNGKVLSTYKLEGFEYDGEHCNSPVFSNGFIYFIANDKNSKGAVKLALSENGGKLKEIWYNKSIHNNFHGYVTVGDRLYTTVKGNWLKALDIENGSVADSLKIPTGSVIHADGKLICYGTNGEVNLVKIKQDSIEIMGDFKVKEGSGQHFAYPVLADGVLFIRHGDALMAYKVN